MLMMMSSRAPGRCDTIELTTTAEGRDKDNISAKI
jgi:hypothetical protein